MPRCPLAAESPPPSGVHNGMFQSPLSLFLLPITSCIYLKVGGRNKTSCKVKKTHFCKKRYKQIWRVREGLKKLLNKSGCKMFFFFLKKKSFHVETPNEHFLSLIQKNDQNTFLFETSQITSGHQMLGLGNMTVVCFIFFVFKKTKIQGSHKFPGKEKQGNFRCSD